MTRQFLIYKILNNKKIYWGICFLYLSFVAYASLCPIPLVTQEDLPKSFKFSLEMFFDKILHLGSYVGAGFLFKGVTQETKKLIISLSLFGMAMEVGQYFIPTRSFEILDMLANCLGVAIGIAISNKLAIDWQKLTLKLYQLR